ncbi:sugar kinase [Plesiomonas shigelloides]|uniref:sugar kinase n=1 Tax=Plesiomonas shigelloides TaxID=703 RepID=UPI001C5B6150|nr:sugar kinase [Plesiomonas shigelloides]
MPAKIAVIGECMIEMSGKPFHTQTQAFGGDTLNTAIYLSRLLPDATLSYITALGTDEYSDLMQQAWQNEGIDCQFVFRDKYKLPGLYAITTSDDGERSFHYWRSDSAAKQLCDQPGFSAALSYMRTCDLIYLSGISLAILPEHAKVKLLNALQDLKARGVTIAVDSNYRPKLWLSHTAAREWMNQLYQLADLALLTVDDENLLYQTPLATPEQVAERVTGLGVTQIVLKLGKEGAIWYQQGQSEAVPAEVITHIVDTTAAGDSFNAAFIAAKLQGKGLSECCQWGNQLAGTVIQHRGAIIAKEQLPALV